MLPLLLGGPEANPEADSLLDPSILVAPPMGKAAMDSRLFLPKSVDGTRDIVTTECLLPPGCGGVDCDRVARKAASRGDGPEPSPPRSLSRRTCGYISIYIYICMCVYSESRYTFDRIDSVRAAILLLLLVERELARECIICIVDGSGVSDRVRFLCLGKF